MKITVDKNIREIPYYPKAMLYGMEEGWVRLASNENPLPPSPRVISSISEALLFLNRYPGGEQELKVSLSRRYGVEPEQVVLGNGSDELIEMILRAMKTRGRDRVIISHPAFPFYSIASKIYGYETIGVPIRDMKTDLDSMLDAIDERTRVIFLNNPLNPTGTIFEEKPFLNFLEKIPDDILVVVDEAYAEFAESGQFPQSYRYVDQYPLVTLRTFSKAYALAGLRVGYSISEPSLASFFERTRQPFSMNTLALVAAGVALDDQEYLKKVLDNNVKGKEFFCAAFKEMSIPFVPSEANFLLIRIGDGAEEITKRLFAEKILARWMGAYNLPEYIRVSVGKPDENKRFIEALKGNLSA